MDFLQQIRELLPTIEGQEIKRATLLALGAAKLMFIGNGGSASLASHMAIDWTKTIGIPALCFNDSAALTAISNDISYHDVFSQQITWFGYDCDVLFAISASGQSFNIIKAVDVAAEIGMKVITFSGFSPDNSLRAKGMVNFYVPSNDYGLVECSHLILNHAILNAAAGLKNA